MYICSINATFASLNYKTPVQEDKLGEFIMDNLLKELREEARKGHLSTLTIADIPNLIGKRIQTIYFGYRGQDGVKDFVVGEIISEWVLAEKEDYSHINENFATRQDYWNSYMTEEQKRRMQRKLKIMTKEGENTGITTDIMYDGGLFWCSDSDRYVQFRVVE